VNQKAVLKLLQTEHDVHAFDDMPPGILAGFSVFWAILLGLFWAFFTGDTQSRFAVAVASLLIGFFFGVPYLMARQAKPKLARSSYQITIHTGTISTKEAAVQVLLIPSALILAIAAMAIIKALVW
jgi:hypothetical protein